VAVAWLAIDEEPAGIDARRLQALGVHRDVAEEPDDTTVALAERELAHLPFEVFEDATVEDVFEAMAEKYPNQPRAVFFDSLQTVRTRTSGSIDSIRERINDVVFTAKRYSRMAATRAMVFFTSELSRGAYRSKNSEDRIEDMAAFKESGAIEYGGHVLLVLRTAEGDASITHVSVPKNRTGRKGQFALKLNFESATFSPVELEQTDGADPLEGIRAEIVFELKGEGFVSLGDLVKRIKRNKQNTLKALASLVESQIIVKRDGAYALASEAQ